MKRILGRVEIYMNLVYVNIEYKSEDQPMIKNNPPMGVTGPKNLNFFPKESDKTRPYMLKENRKIPRIKLIPNTQLGFEILKPTIRRARA